MLRLCVIPGLLLTAGCLGGFPRLPDPAEAPAFDPRAFFDGHTRGEGTLSTRGGATRSLHVEGQGTTEPDGTFRLDQTVTFADGKREVRTWRLHDAGAGRYTATLSDAEGTVKAEAAGNRFHVRYLLRQPAVYMEQELYLQPDGNTVLNRATVTVLGVPWARLAETITRVPATASRV